MKWQSADAAFGDMVRVKIGSVFHYGVYAGDDRIIAFGLPPVPEYANEPDRFLVVETDMDVFCCGRIPEIAVLDRAERRKRIPPETTVRLARERLGTDGYHLIRNNCEHFAYECVFGERKSLQEEAVFRMWNARPILNVYVAEADRFTLGFPVPEERRREIAACGDASVRQARIANWALLRLAATHSFSLDPDEVAFSRRKHGGWTADRFRFSFSHADGLCCVAVSNAPVGVDLETVGGISRRFDEKKLEKMRARIFTNAERDAYPDTIEDFLIGWTRKEALFKQSDKRVFSPGGIDTLEGGAATYLLSEPSRAILSVSGQHVDSVRLYRPEDGGFQRIAAEGPLTR